MEVEKNFSRCDKFPTTPAIAVNFTTDLAFSRLRSRFSRDFGGGDGLPFSLRSCSFVQFLIECPKALLRHHRLHKLFDNRKITLSVKKILFINTRNHSEKRLKFGAI